MSTDAPTLSDVVSRLDAIAARLDQPAQRFLSVDSAARYCDLSKESIRRAIARGDLQAHRAVRGKVLLDRLQIDAFVLGSANRRVSNGRGRRR